MRKVYFAIVYGVVWVLTSCSPKVTSNMIHKYPQQDSLEDVVLFKEKEALPADAEWIGSIGVEGKGNYSEMAEMTRLKAWKEGGKYVRVRDFGVSSVRSDIHFMNSDVYHQDTTKVNNVVSLPQSGSQSVSPPVNTSIAYASPDLNTESSVPVSPLEQLTPYTVRAFVGYGRRLNKVNSNLNLFEKEHVKRLLNGVLFGCDFLYYFNSTKGRGVGFRYQVLHSTSSDAAAFTYENGTTEEGVWTETVNISFIGPLYSERSVSRNGKHLLISNVGLGLLLYRDNSKFKKDNTNGTGSNLGYTCDLNYSYFVTDKLSIGAALSLTVGSVGSLRVSDGNKTETIELSKENREGLLHMGLSAQIVYTF